MNNEEKHLANIVYLASKVQLGDVSYKDIRGDLIKEIVHLYFIFKVQALTDNKKECNEYTNISS